MIVFIAKFFIHSKATEWWKENLIISYFELQGFEIWLYGKKFHIFIGEKTHYENVDKGDMREKYKRK